MRTRKSAGALAVVMLFFASLTYAEWVEIPVSAVLETLPEDRILRDEGEQPVGFVDDRGIERLPDCSDGLLDPNARSFSFFVDRADTGGNEDLLIYFAGGGACWDATTCVGTLVEPDAQPTYFPQFAETAAFLELYANDPSGAAGILSTAPSVQDDNPYADFTKVYIPYCTGDVHIGSSDTFYHYRNPISGLEAALTVRHRGFDNLQVVLKWLEQNVDKQGLGKVTVAGSSAGGYAAPIAFPEIRDRLGEAPDYSIIVDSSNGVFTNGFLDQALGGPANPGVWGARPNVPDILQPVLDLNADRLWTRVLQTIGHAYWDTRISQSTAAYDGVQALILHFMQQVDDGAFPTANVGLETILEWSLKARASMLTTAFTVFNYRRYLAAGAGHIHLIDPPPNLVSFETNSYFDEDSARGIFYTDWLDDMLNNRRLFFRTDWRNLGCFPNCLP